MKTMRKLIIFSLFILILCFSASCGKKKEKETVKDKPGTVYVLNGFEDSRDLFSLRPSVQQMSASMEIVGKDAGQVKTGKGSMKYTYERGNWPDMVLHIRESEYPKLDIANLNKMNLSVYNDSEKAVSGSIAVVVNRNKTLLTEDFTLEPNQWNELDFRLSALACEYNADQILGFRFRLKAEEGTVFYFDDWSVTMGAKNTEEDDKWEPILLEIIERIDNLPKEIAMKDAEELETLYMDYAELPELYRNIVPNYSSLYASIEQFAAVKFAADEDALERTILAFDEFYGIGQIDSANYAMLYQTDVKFEDEKGSIKVVFDGATKESYFPYKMVLDPKRYDYLEISFFNDDSLRKVVYFNWNHRVVIEPQTWGTLKIPGAEMIKEGNLIVDTIDEQGSRINSSGTVYMGAMHAYRRDLLAELQKLPNAADVQMKRDIKYLTLIERTMQLYEDTPETERVNIPKELVTNLQNCYAKISGYSTVFDATQEDIQFGTPDCQAVGEAVAAQDEDYGPVWELNFTEKADGAYAAGFQFTKEFKDNKNMFFYIYNPQSTEQTMELYSDGSWNNLGMHVLVPGWNEIAITTDVESNYFIFGLFAKTQDVVGTWKVSSLYQVSDEIVNRDAAAGVSEMIQALPDASKIVMPRDLKYVADIWAAQESFDALSKDGQSRVSASLKNKLAACMKAIEGYKAAINANTDEMMAGANGFETPGTVTTKHDKDYGAVFALNLTGKAEGDYSGGFQVNKDISAEKNLFFYIFNPFKEDKNIELYADPSWNNLEGRTLKPGWNLIELPKDTVIKQYIFGLFSKDTDAVGEWLITSIYSKTSALVDKQESSYVEELIAKLPNGSKIVMPEDLKYVAAICEANDAYQALSANGKKLVSASAIAKLNGCLNGIAGYKAVVNAKTDNMMVGANGFECPGTLTRKEDMQAGPVFVLNLTGKSEGDYSGGFQVEKDLSAEKNLVFYIFNPFKEDKSIELYADSSWKNLEARTLKAGWNKVEIPNDIKIERYIFGLFAKGTDAVGEWKITSIYAISDAALAKEEAKKTELEIKSLPNPKDLTADDKFVVEAVNKRYENLVNKSLVSAASKKKLADCMTTIKRLTGPVAEVVLDVNTGALVAVDGSLVTDIKDDKFVTVAGITSDNSCLKLNATMLSDAFKKATKVSFYVYNPTGEERTLYYTTDWTAYEYTTLQANAWTRVDIASDYLTANKDIYIYLNDGSAVGANGFKVSNFYELDKLTIAKEDAKLLVQQVEALPAVGNLKKTDKEAVKAARAAYNALSAEAKKEVPNTTLTELAARETQMYKLLGAEWKVVYDAATNVLEPTDKVTAGVANADFGKVMQIAAGSEYVMFKASWKNDDFVGAGVVSFYVYNASDAETRLYYTTDWTNVIDKLLKPNAWTRIDIADTANDNYITGTADIYIYPNDAKAIGEDWLISSFYADLTQDEMDSFEATQMSNMIQTLPDVADLQKADKDLVKSTRFAYESMTPNAKSKVAAEAVQKLEACEAQLYAMLGIDWKIVLDAATQTLEATDENGTITPGNANTVFGSVMKMSSNTTCLKLTTGMMNAVYKDADTVSFYVYNASAQEARLYYTIDWSNEVENLLPAQSWTRVDITDTDTVKYISECPQDIYFYLNNGAQVGNENWMISSLYADLTEEEKSETEAKPIIELIESLPAADSLTIDHIEQVKSVEAAYGTLSTGAQAKVSNKAILDACVAKINGLIAGDVNAMIELLPDASTITMPESTMWLADIDEAKKAYDNLGEYQSLVEARYVAKLNACLTATEGYAVVANAKTDTMLKAPDAVFEGSIDKELHETAGPVYAMNITSKANDSYAAGFRIEKDMSNRRIVFSIYNPTQSATELWMYADNWTGLGTQYIDAGWNKITLELNEAQATSAIFGFIPGSFEVANTKWLITSVYSVSDEALAMEQVKVLTAILTNMKSADEITSLDDTEAIATVEGARERYNALNAYQSKVDPALVEKLVACEAKIAELSTSKTEGYVAYATNGSWFDYYYGGTGDNWTDATLGDVEVGGQTAKWSGSINITAQGGGYLRAYQGLDLTVAKLQEYKAQGYTHLRIPYYLEAPADLKISVHNTWEWAYKEAANAVRNTWTYFDYPIDDLLLSSGLDAGGSKTVLEGINSGARASFGLMNFQINTVGNYKLYLGDATLVTQ